MDIDYLGEIRDRVSEEKTYNDIFMMRLWGADPMQSPYYRDFIIQKQNEVNETKATLSEAEVTTYKNVYETILKDMKDVQIKK